MYAYSTQQTPDHDVVSIAGCVATAEEVGCFLDGLTGRGATKRIRGRWEEMLGCERQDGNVYASLFVYLGQDVSQGDDAIKFGKEVDGLASLHPFQQGPCSNVPVTHEECHQDTVKEIAQRSAAFPLRCAALRYMRPHAALRYAAYTFALRCADVSLAFDEPTSGERRPHLRILTFHPHSCVFAPCS